MYNVHAWASSTFSDRISIFIDGRYEGRNYVFQSIRRKTIGPNREIINKYELVMFQSIFMRCIHDEHALF